MADQAKKDHVVVVHMRPPDPGGPTSPADKPLHQRHREDLRSDLLKVKAENVTLYGKLRGYRTLEQMLAQAKDEATTYKRLYEEKLADEIDKENKMTGNSLFDMLTGNLPTDMDVTDAADENQTIILTSTVVTDAAGGGESDGEHAPNSFRSEPSHASMAPDVSSHQSMPDTMERMEESLPVSQPHSRDLRVDISNSPMMTQPASMSPDSIAYQEKLMGIVRADRKNWKTELAETKEKLEAVTRENENLKRWNRMRDAERSVEQRTTNEEREGSPASVGDWVHVQNERHQREAETPVGPKSEEGGDLSPAHKAKVDKMRQKMTRLHRANREWEDHCKGMEVNHKRELAQLQDKLEEERARFSALKDQEESRQREMDSLFQSIYRQQSDGEVEKLKQELHLEKQRSASYLERCLEMERERHVLEEQEERRSFFDARSPPGRGGGPSIDSMKTEIEVLKLQVTTYKEDFDTERKDREKLQREKHQWQTTLSNVLEESEKLRNEVTTKNEALSRANAKASEKEQAVVDLKRKVQLLEQQIQQMQICGAPNTYPGARPTAPIYGGRTGDGYYNGYRPPPHASPPHPSAQRWPCYRCSYANEGERTLCEMCGTPKYSGERYDHGPYPHIIPHSGGSPGSVKTPPTWN